MFGDWSPFCLKQETPLFFTRAKHTQVWIGVYTKPPLSDLISGDWRVCKGQSWIVIWGVLLLYECARFNLFLDFQDDFLPCIENDCHCIFFGAGTTLYLFVLSLPFDHPSPWCNFPFACELLFGTWRGQCPQDMLWTWFLKKRNFPSSASGR